MSAMIQKVLIGDLSYIQEYEEYFSDMSKEGLHLHSIGRFFTYFEKGEPQNLNYRIDLFKKDEKEQKIGKHKRAGWNFVGERKPYLIFSTPENSHLKELYGTPEEQKMAIVAAKREIYGGGIINIISIIGVLLIILAFYQRIKLESGFYLFLRRESLGISIIIPLLSYFKERRKKKNLEKIEKTLDSNEFLKHHGDYSLMKMQSIVNKTISLIIILSIIGTISYKLSQEKRINLLEIDNLESLPIITIGDIEKAIFSHDRDRNFGNTLYQSWSYLIPKEYTLIQVKQRG